MDKEIATIVSNSLKEVLDKWHSDIKELGLPLINGALEGEGHTLINVLNWQDEFKKFPKSDKSFAVLRVIYRGEGELEDEKIIKEFSISIKIDSGNVWLHTSVFNLLLDELDEDADLDEEDDDASEDFGYREKTAEELAAINEVALQVAKEKIFGDFKNKGQRESFVVSFVKKNKITYLPEDYQYEASCRAEMIYEFGILPSQAKELQKQGMSINEIAKELSITKAKAQKVIARDTPDNILELMS